MRITCLKSNLARSLSIVSRALATRTTLPITLNILMEAQESGLRLTATDLELSMTTFMTAVVEEEGAFTVPGRLLMELVNSLPNAAVDVDLPEGSGVLGLRCGKAEMNLHGARAEEYPPVPRVAGEKVVEMDAKELREVIGRVVLAAAREDSRPVLTGVLFAADGMEYKMVAADGFRLAVETGVFPEELDEPFSAVVPARALTELARLLGDGGQMVEITMASQSQQMMFRVGDVELVTRLVQGNYPKIDGLLPQDWATRATFDLEGFRQAVKLASLFTRGGSEQVRLEMTPGNNGGDAVGTAVIWAQSEDVGENRGEAPVQSIEGTEGKIAFNSKYLGDLVGALPAGQIVMEMQGSSSPASFTAPTVPGYRHILMPIFVTW